MVTQNESSGVSRRSFLKTLGATGAGAGLAGMMPAGAWAKTRAQRPNIVFIMCDDLSWGDVDFTMDLTTPPGTKRFIKTPNLNHYAREKGMRFSRFYSASCTCSPTRCACITGKYSNRFGIDYACCGDSNQGIPWGTHTTAQLLKNSGYTTCHIGKWHLGGESEFDMEERLAGKNSNFPGPNQLGFEDAYYNGVGPCYYRIGDDGSFYVSNNPDEHGSMAECIRYNDQPSYELGGKTIEGAVVDGINRIDSHFEIAAQKLQDYSEQTNPFFMQLWTYVPHTPHQMIEEYAPQYQEVLGCEQPICRKEDAPFIHWKQSYASMVSCLDANMGRFFEKLDELGIAENTLVIFTSDNGGIFCDPLKGGKWHFYEGGIRVPTFAVWKGTIPEGSINDNVCISMDLLPTFCELAGTPMDWVNTTDPFDRNHLDGTSFLGSMIDETPVPDRTLYFDGQNEDVAIIRDGKHKYVVYDVPNSKAIEYFDIESDPAEKSPVADVPGLKAELDAWIAANEAANSPTKLSNDPESWGFPKGYEYEAPFTPVSSRNGGRSWFGGGREPSLEVSGRVGRGVSGITLKLPSADHIRVNILDHTGRLVAQPAAGRLSAGAHRFNLAGIPRGSYVVSVEGERCSLSRKIAIAGN